MSSIEVLQERLILLKLNTLANQIDGHLDQAGREEPPYADFLDQLLLTELNAKHLQRYHRRIQEARFPFQRTVDQFDFAFQPSIPERQLRDLLTLRFVHQAENVLFLGPPGVGKTHLSVALGLEAITQGFSVLFVRVHDMIMDLTQAHREGHVVQRLKTYTRPKLLICDELGYLTMDEVGASLFFQLISARYEHGATILTSNKSFGEWNHIFGETVIATAILDRLLHHAHTFNIRGDSYRLRERRKAGTMPVSSPHLDPS